MARHTQLGPHKIVITKSPLRRTEKVEPKKSTFASTAAVIDEYCSLVEKLAPFAKDMKRKRELHSILDERVAAHASSKDYAIELERNIYSVLNTDKIRTDMALSWLNQYSRDTTKCCIRIRKLKKKAQAA